MKTKTVLILCFILALPILFKLNLSSVGMYNEFLYLNKKDKNLILFRPRAIRSDEWLVATPKTVGAINNQFKIINTNIGLGENLVTGNFPIKHWKTLFNPSLWGYFFLPIDYALAWQTWVNNGIILAGLYYLIKYFLKKSALVLPIALSVFFTPFVVWWSFLPGFIIATGGIIFLSFVGVLKNFKRSRNKLLLNSLVFIYFSVNFLFNLYPPFQIPVIWLFILLAIPIFCRFFSELNKNNKMKLLALLCSLLIMVALVILQFYIETSDIFDVVNNTIYPGKRLSTGGEMPFLHFLNGFYNIQLLVDVKGSGGLANPSEASNFLFLYPYILPVVIWTLIKNIMHKRKNNLHILVLTFYLIFTTYFLFFKIPTVLARLTLLSYVTSKRMLIGVGLANILLVVLLLKEKIFNYNHLRLIALLPAAIAFFVNLYFGFYLRNMYPNFIQSAPKIFIISTIAFTLVFTVINGNKKIFVFILLMFSLLSTYSVHPIYRGTGPLLNNNLSNEFKRIKRNNNKPFRVVSYDSGYFENFMIANGINSLNGTYFYPQKNLMKILDPKNKYENVWNRFATVNYVFDKTNKNRFILSYADNYQINISPCNDVLNRLNVQYFIFENKQKLKCARLYKHLSFPARNFFIYKRL